MTAWITTESMLLAGGLVSVVLWLLILAAAGQRACVHALRSAISAVHDMRIDAPVSRPIVRRPGVWYAPGTLIFVLAVSATVAIWMNPASLAWLTIHVPATPLGLVGMVATGLIWLAAAGSVLQARRIRSLVGEHEALVAREETACDALEAVPVLISACRPDGMRSQFNRRFLDVTGKTMEELQGHGWLGCVHAEDRDRLMVVEPRGRGESVELEYGIFAADGRNRWIKETLVPRVGDDGRVSSFIATGVDVTRQVEAEAASKRALEELQGTLEERVAAHMQADERLREAHARELAEAEAAQRASSQRLESEERAKAELERVVQEMRASAERASEESAALRGEADAARAELEAALADRGHAQAETQKLQDSVAKLQTLVEQLERDEAALRAERERILALVQSARGEAADVQGHQAQLLDRIGRLTERVQGLEQELAAVKAAHAEAQARLAERAAAPGQPARDDGGAAAGRERGSAAVELARQLRDLAAHDAEISALEGARARASEVARLARSAAAEAEVEADGSAASARMPVARLACNLGAVVELGCDSARIRGASVPSAPVVVELDTAEGPLELRGDVASVVRQPDGVDLIVRFAVDGRPELRRRLLATAFAHRPETAVVRGF